MDARRKRNVGLPILAAGLATVVLEVLLCGLITDSGAADGVSIVTAIAGAMVA